MILVVSRAKLLLHLPVKLFPKRSSPGAHSPLHLRNVLHVPTCICKMLATRVLAIIPTSAILAQAKNGSPDLFSYPKKLGA